MSNVFEPKTIHKQFCGQQHQIVEIVKHKSNLQNDIKLEMQKTSLLLNKLRKPGVAFLANKTYMKISQ